MTLYTGHCVRIHPDGASAVDIGAVTQMSNPVNTQVLNEVTAGSYYAGQTNIQSIDPRITFSTRDLVKVIDTFGLLGLTIKGATNPGVELYQAQLENGVIKSGSNHRKIRIAEGRAVTRRISVSNREDAQADCEVMSLYDGTNLPLIPSGSVALPTLPSDSARYTLHSVVVDEIAIPCLQNVDIDFGLNITMDACSSNLYNEHLSVESVQPVLTFRFLNAASFATSSAVPLVGLIGAHADTEIILRKRSSTGFVADNVAEHILITAAGLLTWDDTFNASGNRRGESSLRLTTRYDGTNAPLVFDTTYAIA